MQKAASSHNVAGHAAGPAKGKGQRLASRIHALVSDAGVSRGQWGISVTTLDGQPLYALNDAQYFTPASNAKLFTTAAAFALLGPDFVSKTYVVEQGAVDAGGILRGGLRLVGTGDPSLSNRRYPYSKDAKPDSKDAKPDSKDAKPAAVIPLATAALDDLAEEVARHGIRRIDGAITGDETFFVSERYGTGWGWDDLQWEYGAAVSALTLNENVSYLELEAGASAGEPIATSWRDGFAYYAAEWDPARPATPATAPLTTAPLTTAPFTTAAGTANEVGVARDPGSMRVHLFGSAAAGAKPIHLALAVEEPAVYAATAFRAALQAHGVSAPGPALRRGNPAQSTALFEEEVRRPLVLEPLAPGIRSLPFALQPGEAILAMHVSPALREEATVINKVSQNLHAELLLRQLGKSQTGEGSFVEGARVVRQFLRNAGVDGDDFFFYDGSGMSPQDVVTPRATTALLAYAARQTWGAGYRATLPVAGLDGTLSGRFTKSPLKGRLLAKTGTLGGVYALSGYLTAASGRALIVSIFSNHRRPGGDAERRTIDKIAEAIAAAY